MKQYINIKHNINLLTIGDNSHFSVKDCSKNNKIQLDRLAVNIYCMHFIILITLF